MSEKDDLYSIARKAIDRANCIDSAAFASPLEALKDAANEVGKSWSGSWLGYHSRIYYAGFKPSPPGAHFSQEWGFMNTFSIPSTSGDWREYQFDDVVSLIMNKAGNPDLGPIELETEETKEFFEDARSTLVSRLSNALRRASDDKFLDDLLTQAKKLKIFDAADFISYMRPSGQIISRDMLAIEKGFHTPPHIIVLARVQAVQQPFQACKDLGKIAQRAASHLSDQEAKAVQQERIGTNVFIGHGRSKVWKDLRDFIRDRLRLPWDEFNRVPVAGVTNIARLSQMLDGAAIAFLVMTAEDEQ